MGSQTFPFLLVISFPTRLGVRGTYHWQLVAQHHTDFEAMLLCSFGVVWGIFQGSTGGFKDLPGLGIPPGLMFWGGGRKVGGGLAAVTP